MGTLASVHRSPSHSADRTGLAIAALAAIPVVSVSGVALVADVASHTDPGRMWLGLVAVGAGIASGLVAVRVVRAADEGFVSLSAAIVRWFGPAPAAAVTVPSLRPPSRPELVPAVVAVRRAVRRRGPPTILR